MGALTAPVAAWFREHHGVASRHELTEFGLSAWQISWLVEQRILFVVHRDVFRLATNPATFEAACRAACAADREIVVCGPSAGRLWGFRKVPKSEIVHVLAPLERRPISRGVVLRRCAKIDDQDVVTRDDGIRLTTPARTLLELATEVSDLDLESIVEQVLDGHCGPPAVWGVLRRLGARGRPGTARLRRVLDSRPIWHKPKDSNLEVIVLAALRARGIDLEPQVRVRVPGFGEVHLDGADRELRWGVETDHVTWHGGRSEWQRDRARDRALRRIGWVVERVTDQEINGDRQRILGELEASYRARKMELRTG